MAVYKKDAKRSHVSLGSFSHTSYQVDTALDISSTVHAYKLLDDNTDFIQFDSDSPVRIHFDNSATDTITTNNLRYPDNTVVTEAVPSALKPNVYAHFKQITSVAAKSLRLVER